MEAAGVADLLGAYALGAVDDDEREAVERLLASSADARAELGRHLEVAEHLGGMAAAAPPDDLWRRISEHMAEGETRHVDEKASIAHLDAARSRRRAASWVITTAAAAIALVLGLALVAQTRRVSELNETIAARDASVAELNTELASAEVLVGALRDTVGTEGARADQLAAVLADRDVQVADLQTALTVDPLFRAAELAQADRSATFVDLAAPDAGRPLMTVVIQEDGRGYVTSSDLAPLDPERTYQLWAVMNDGRVISAAVLGNRPGVDTFVVDLENLEALAITEEIDGGVVTSENDAVLVGTIDV